MGAGTSIVLVMVGAVLCRGSRGGLDAAAASGCGRSHRAVHGGAGGTYGQERGEGFG